MGSIGCLLLKLRHYDCTEDEIGVGINARFPRWDGKEVVRSAGPSCVTVLSYKTPRCVHQVQSRLLTSWSELFDSFAAEVLPGGAEPGATGWCSRCPCRVLAALLRYTGLSMGPGLLNQKRQVVYPIVFTYPAGINNMGQIVFRIRDDKIGVRN